MKPAKTMTIAMAMLFITMTAIKGAPEEEGAPRSKNELQLVCSPELESLANQLVKDYSKEHEGTQIQVTPVSDHEVYGTLQEGTVALVNKDCLAGLKGEHYFKMVVGRDAIVPLMNANHPQRDLIMENGFSAEGFAKIYTTPGNITWGEVLGVPDQSPVHAYAPGKACAKEYLSEFLQIEPGDLTGIEIMEPEEMLKKIGSDPGAIGFCSLACLMNMEQSDVDAGIGLVPVDMDGDGRMDGFEDIYESSSMLSHAIFVGRFPRTLYSRVYAVTAEQPAGAGEMAFLEWMISEGQQTLASAGIMALGHGERASGMEHLSGHDQAIAYVSVKASPARGYLVVAGFLLLIGLLTLMFARITGTRGAVQMAASLKGEGSAAFPGGLFFDRSHTWAYMEKSGRVRIGIDDFLQNVTGPVTRVVMKHPGEQIKRGDSFLTLIQNGKRLEIKSPVSGVVEEQNRELVNDVSLLNSDPYAAGWVLMVKPLNWISELKSYFMGEPYANWLKTEVARLKEFLTSTLKLQDTKEHALVLQDGGEISGGVLESFGPEVWEEFQDGFINRSK
ncbi:MAG: substrate-binding domain-containing protein [Bacteroidales bacterium]|nr:substrate-binding domain-containing protein [Bacteroidales bacterium]